MQKTKSTWTRRSTNGSIQKQEQRKPGRNQKNPRRTAQSQNRTHIQLQTYLTHELDIQNIHSNNTEKTGGAD